MHIILNVAVGGRFTYVDSNGDGRLEPLPKETILTSFANGLPQLRVEYVRCGQCLLSHLLLQLTTLARGQWGSWLPGQAQKVGRVQLEAAYCSRPPPCSAANCGWSGGCPAMVMVFKALSLQASVH